MGERSKARLAVPALRHRDARGGTRCPRTALVVRHEGAITNPESPGPIRLNGDADTWPDHDHLRRPCWNLQRHRSLLAEQVGALVLGVQAECLAEPPWTASKIAVACRSASQSGDIDAFDH